MTKEQEEAIEYFKKHIKYFEEQIKFIEATDCDYYDEELELYQNRIKQFNTILSMLKEKEQEINNINSQLNTYKIRQIEYDKREKNLKNEINENVKRKINILKDNICNKIKNTKGNLSKDKVIGIVYKEAE